MKTLTLLALPVLLLAITNTALSEEAPPHSKFIKVDEAAILTFCKDAIAKADPKISLDDLRINSIQFAQEVEGRGVTPTTRFEPQQLDVMLIRLDTREVKPIEGSDKWQVGYKLVRVIISPDGWHEKVKVVTNVSTAFAHSTKPEP
jgi:hypothetical protein